MAVGPSAGFIVSETVTLTNAERAFSRTATTNDKWTFIFPVEIRTLVDTPAEISAVLQVDNINETVNVPSDTAEALLNTQDATIGNGREPPASFSFLTVFEIFRPEVLSCNTFDFEHEVGAVGFGGGLIAGREVSREYFFGDV